MDDDDLGDLSAVMGDDYGHGFKDEDGDPNVKPKKAPAPKRSGSAHQDKIELKFPAQKQYLTKLVVQCMPCSRLPGFHRSPEGVITGNPFEGFSTAESVGGKIEKLADPVAATSATFTKLIPGQAYVFRLVCTNPTGTVSGKPSAPIWCLPSKPKAPTLGYATGRSVEIKFAQQGKGAAPITALGIEMAVNCKDPFSASNKKKGLLEDRSSLIQDRTTGLIRNLKPGQAYVFRLVIKNAAGTVIGATSKPLRTLPKPPLAPREDSKQRTASSIALKWSPHGKAVSKLVLEYGPLSGKSTFETLAKTGGKSVTLDNPANIEGHVCSELKSDTNYVFRLVAFNASGKSAGAILGPVKTVTYTPDMLDKSGWLVALPKEGGKKTLGRRLSLSKKGGSQARFWYTIDGKLLSWAAAIDGEEVDFVHLGKVKQVTQAGNIIEIVLKPKIGAKASDKPEKFALMAESDDPNQTHEELAGTWASAIENAILGKAEDAEVAAVAEMEAEAEAAEFGAAGGEDEDAGGFEMVAGEDDEEAGGFGMDDDEEEDEDAGGFGAAEEDEEEAGGFGFE